MEEALVRPRPRWGWLGRVNHHLGLPPVVCVTVVLALAALLSTIGADSQWLAALGHAIVQHHGIPTGLPFASAPAARWPNVPALGEVVFYELERLFSTRGLMLAQIAAV